MGLRGRVWVIFGPNRPQTQAGCGFRWIEYPVETRTISRWLIHASTSASWTRIGSPAFGLSRSSAVYLVIGMRGWSRSCVAQKNGLQAVWPRADGLVRPNDAARARSLQRRHARLPGFRGAACALQGLRQSDARTSGVPG